MFGFLLAFVLITIVLMVVIETVTVRFIYKSELVIRIDFLLFELILYPSRKKRRKKRNIIAGIRMRFARAAATKKALDHLLSHSRITVKELNITNKTDNPAELALSSQRTYSMLGAIITYLSLKTQAITTDQSTFITNGTTEDTPPVTIDISLASTLFDVLSSLAVFILSANRYKRRRGRGIV